MKALALGAVAFGLISLAPAQRSFSGRLSSKPGAFNRFIARNDGKTVRLDVTFDPEPTGVGNIPDTGRVFRPYGYRGSKEYPLFGVGDRSYFIPGVPSGRRWEDALNWNPNQRRLKGTFRVKKNRSAGGGRWFDLTPVKLRSSFTPSRGTPTLAPPPPQRARPDAPASVAMPATPG